MIIVNRNEILIKKSHKLVNNQRSISAYFFLFNIILSNMKMNATPIDIIQNYPRTVVAKGMKKTHNFLS